MPYAFYGRAGRGRKSWLLLGGGAGLLRDLVIGLGLLLRRCLILVGVRSRQHHAEEAQDDDAHQDHDDEPGDGEADPGHPAGDVEQHAAQDRMAPTIASVTTASKPASTTLPDAVVVRRGRVVFKARRPAALVLPLAAVTETGGIICLIAGATIGWFIVAAPVATLLVTGLLFRPTLELTREGLLQRQYPFTSLTRWDVIDRLGIARAGNRMVLGYKLVDGVPPPRRQPAAAMLRAADAPYDGGFFVDSLAGDSGAILEVIERYLREPALRESLPAARR
jgi:hypothetical protein